jgi:lipoprotein-anchoring transpeptidase ErfK/SrfK
VRRFALVAVPLLLAVAFLYDPDAPGPARAHATPVAPAGLAAPSPAAAYRRARGQGQPIAVLTRATVLRASPGGRPIARLGERTEWHSTRVLATLGERGGWLRVLATALRNEQTGWIPASAAGITSSPWLVRASLARRQVEVLLRGRVVRRFPVAIGRPDTPTPTGRFAVTDKLWIEGASRAYGCCAVALTGHQPHIEPGWRGGDRLAIHATGAPGTIGTAASFGCLRASDADARWLVRRLYLGTIVEISA